MFLNLKTLRYLKMPGFLVFRLYRVSSYYEPNLVKQLPSNKVEYLHSVVIYQLQPICVCAFHCIGPVYKLQCLSRCLSMLGNPASRWTGDFLSKSVSLIQAYLWTFSGVGHYDILFVFWGPRKPAYLNSWGVSRGRICGCGCWSQ